MKPPRPKRVSSAKLDTVNRPGSLPLPARAVLPQNEHDPDTGPNVRQEQGQTEPPLRTQQDLNMGSGSSIHTEPVVQGTYRQRENYLTLSHAQISDGTEPQPYESSSKCHTLPPGGTFLHPATLKSDFKEFSRIKKAPLTELKFKQSTFKGGSMSAVTLQRETLQKSPDRQSYTNLASIFPQRGRYNFNKNSSFDKLDADYSHSLLKPTTILQNSDKFHHQAPPDIILAPDPSTDAFSDKYERNTALLYGTLPNSRSTGSSSTVSEPLQKSVTSRVRNSLRNLRFYSRNLGSEPDKEVQKPPQQDLLPPSSEFYDAMLSCRDDGSLEQTWLDDEPSSHDSGILLHHNTKHQTVKTAVAVEIPSVATLTKTKVANDNQKTDKVLLNPNQRPNDLQLRRTPEQESIEALDAVIANHSRNLTSLSSMKSFISETKLTLGGNSESSPKNDLSKNQGTKSHMKNGTHAVAVGRDRSFQDSPDPEPAVFDHTKPGIRDVTPVDAQIFSSASNSPTKIPVVKGLSISDVLSQGNLSDILRPQKARSSSGSSAPLVASHHSRSSFNFDSDSFDDSFVSTSGSQDLASHGDHGDRQVLVNAARVRKTGWLVTKHLLVSKRGRVDQAAKRNWQKFWVNMKGGHLLFYDLEGKEDEEESPKFMLPVDGALVQAVPEHAKKDNVFCMSTSMGSVYLMQGGGLKGGSQTEVDGWVKAIHTEAAVIFAMRGDDESTISKSAIEAMLRADIERRKAEIDMDEKMKKMAELQMSLVSDVKSRRAITEQITKWEENLEKNQVHVFRFRCYLSSLDDTESPNPKAAMASTCKSSKQLLSNMRLLNVSTLHALVNSREEVAIGITITKPSPPKRKSLGANITRSGSFNDSLKPESSPGKDVSSPGKSKKSNIFASLRGFDTWRGSATSGGKKKHQRTSVSGILSAFGSGSTPSSQSSTKESDEKPPGQRISERTKTPSNSRKHYSNSVFYEPLHGRSEEGLRMGENSDDTALTPGSSDDDLLDSLQNSNGGSLDSLLLAPPDAWCTPIQWNSSTVRVAVSTSEFVTVTTTENMTVKQLLEIVCQRKQLDSSDYFLAIDDEQGSDDEKNTWTKPDNSARLAEYDCGSLRIMKKRMYSIELRNSKGFTVLPKAICRPIVISEVASRNSSGLRSGDEILTINGELTAEMSDADAMKRLNRGKLRLLVRTCFYEDDCRSKIWWLAGESKTRKSQSSESTLTESDKSRERSEGLMSVTEEYLQNIVVPPPPIISRLQPPFIRSPFTTAPRPSLGARHGSAEDIISLLVVPAPDTSSLVNGYSSDDMTEGSKHDMALVDNEEFINELLKKAETVTSMCRQLHVMGSSATLLPLSPGQRVNQMDNGGGSDNVDTQRVLSEIEKVYKVLHELVDTETVYVKDLECLLKRYLEPLHAEGFFAGSEIDSLLQNVQGMLQFQETFLLELSQAFDHIEESEIATLNHSLVSVSSAFLQHAAQFKLYAVFSTCHTVAQDLLEKTKTNSPEFREFLDARNPKKQHASTVESYLIKPIQRVLKYPLLLRELLNLSKSLEQVNSKAKRRLKAALQAMNGVARHINDSQTVHDEFGAEGFHELIKQASLKANYEQDQLQLLALSELLCYCTTEWLNVSDEVGKLKKGSIMEMLIMVFRSAIVLLCRGTKREKKKAVTPQRETARPSASVSDFVYMNVITRTEISVDGNCPAFSTEKTSNVWQLNQEHQSGLRTIYRLSCDSVESKQRVVKTIEYVMKNCERKSKYKDDAAEAGPAEGGVEVNANQTSNSSDTPPDNSSKNDSSGSSSPSLSLKETESAKKQREFFYKPEAAPSESQNLSQFTSTTGESKSFHFGLKVLPTRTDSPIMSVRQKITAAEFRPLKTIGPKNEAYFGLEISTLPGHAAAVSRSSSFQSHRGPFLRSEFVTFASAPASPSRSLDSSGSSLTGLKISTQRPHNRESAESNEKSVAKSEGRARRSNSGSPAKYNMVYGVAPYESKL